MAESQSGRFLPIRALRVAAMALLAVLAALLLWQALDGGGESNPDEPRIVSPAELADAAGSSDAPIYWVGERRGAELELTEEDGGNAYVRYLTGQANAGDPAPDFLAIATYGLPGALPALRVNARRTGVELRGAPRGARAWVDPDSPTSVYLAWPGEAYQVEVYDPSPKRALAVALSPGLRPVEPR